MSAVCGQSLNQSRRHDLSTVYLLATFLWCLPVSMAFAQADGHSAHHPGSADTSLAPPSSVPTERAPAQSATPTAGSANAPGASTMGSMGEMMGRPPAKEFYPAMLDLQSFTAEQRTSIEAQARSWLSIGVDGIAAAEETLRHAAAANDAAAAEQATARLRDALAQARSGVTILRSLADAKPPREIAMDWFRVQLNLPGRKLARAESGAFGLSWFHITTMALLGALAAIMAGMRFARFRRANALAARLASAAQQPTSAPLSDAIPISPGQTAVDSPPPEMDRGTPAFAVIDARAATENAALRQIPWKGRLRVAAIFAETPVVKTFRLRTPNGGPIPFSFVPGQFLTYSADIDGKQIKRSYTIASSASQTAYVETTIKREDVGIFSKFMHDHVKEGDCVEVMAPFGNFTFRGTEADSVVLIGGGVGLTPLMAAVRYMADISWPGEIYLIYAARSTEDFIFREELEYLQSRRRNLHIVATMARADGTAWMGAEGPITRELLLSVPNIVKRRIHLCGPPRMMDAIRKILSEIGIPQDQVKTEAFGPALGAVPPPGTTQIASIDPQGSGTPAVGVAPDAVSGPATATIRFVKSNRVVPLSPDKSVLEAAESAGVSIDYSCRAGICGVCKTKLLDGAVTMEVDEALTPQDKAQNLILACQAKSIGNIAVEA